MESDDKALVRAYYEAIYNERQVDDIDRFLSPRFQSAGPGGATMDLATHTGALSASLAGLPDLHLTIEEQIAERGAVVTRWAASGTHKGTLFGIPATGAAIRASAIHIHHVVDGRIVDQWEQFDTMGVLRQLGMLPKPQ